MNKILFLSLIATFQFGYSQSKETLLQEAEAIVEKPQQDVSNNKLYDSAVVEVKPEYPGGMPAFYKFIANKYNVPNAKLNGKVLVSFIIDKEGSITDIKVLRDLGYGTGDEAVRVLKLMPKWIPAMQNGKPVNCRYMLPLTLKTE